MEQNRFSRQLIVLRSVLTGYSGHARLLQTDDGTTLEIRVQTPDRHTGLWAAIVNRDDTGYHAQSLGALQTDERGQATGAFPVENTVVLPEILAIVSTDGADCRLAMSGFFNTAHTVNWSNVRAAACDAVLSGTPPAAAEMLPEADPPSPAATPADETPASSSAAESAGISPDAIWPAEIAALQEEFFTKPAEDVLPDSRYTFILMPATDDQPEYYAGILCAHGIPERVCYAVRGYDRHTPPHGLEEFLWRDGFWATYINIETGDPVDDR